ncbi:VOC family protein [Cellulosimicrobium cellulans]|uniref:VOC family protein n=1 Tax=Cellulosimicrobium cellulans TaxID=1710 RepID=UPI00196240F3|nr:VOC family protein [Cellulosimicrobium cellulans]MBN0039865.1 VOC family protein [Cellulosimicrobium cellulans]
MTDIPGARPAVRQLRLVVEAHDFEAALAFYRDVLGLPQRIAYADGEDDRVAILDVGHATLEIANPAHRRAIDDVEVGRQVAGHLRVAFEVDDAQEATRRAVEAGAELVAPPTPTPWRSLNSRLDAPAGLHITLFQELGGEEGVPPGVVAEPGAGDDPAPGGR